MQALDKMFETGSRSILSLVKHQVCASALVLVVFFAVGAVDYRVAAVAAVFVALIMVALAVVSKTFVSAASASVIPCVIATAVVLATTAVIDDGSVTAGILISGMTVVFAVVVCVVAVAILLDWADTRRVSRRAAVTAVAVQVTVLLAAMLPFVS